MSKRFLPILIILNTFFFLISILLAFKIFEIRRNNNVKGIQYINFLRLADYTTNNHDSNLKYFYEPKAKNTIIEKPDWLDNSATYTINSDTLNERFEYS